MKHVCLVGCGKIGDLHAKNLKGKVRLSFYSRTLQKAEEFKNKFNGVKVFSSYEQIIKDNGIDALILATPPKVHFQQTIWALKENKSVLVEKPLCVNMEEMHKIKKELPLKNGSFLMVAENYYYKPSLKKIKKIMSSGNLGKLKKMIVRKEMTQESNDWRKEYGSLLEGGIHFIALISDIFSREPLKIHAKFTGLKSNPERFLHVDRSCILEMEYSKDQYAKLIYSWETPSKTHGVFQHSILEFEKGKIIFESNGIYIVVKQNLFPKIYFPNLLDITGHKAMIYDFLKCMQEPERKPYSNFERAFRDLKIVFRSYESISSK